ncbi:SAV_2336 N-terminal domain-related protein [Streptomyces sp. NPDC057877]|uniref:SAV_2336 N-terminal domain-related protein n=1 Tax=Streptomyces sp. NPDC057877 TaxID=3346269 RepID=UPI00369B4718
MPSEGERDDDGFDRLAGVLAEARGGVRPTSVELAEVLWLARQMAPAPEPPPTVAETPAEGPSEEPSQAPAPADPPAPPPSPVPPPPDGNRVPLRLPDRPAPAPPPDQPTTPHTRLLAPAPPMLARPLALQRALRPLKRRVPAPYGQELDEEATAHRIARLGARPEWWLPVLRPAAERWLRLRLVYDAGPTMPVWRPLVRELHTALAQSGVFRTVELHRAEADGGVRPGVHPAADGRTVTLLVSDCMGPQWWEGAAGERWYRTLRHWAAHMPLTVVQPLPERLWRDTAMPTTAGLFSAPAPVAPTAALTFTPYSADAAGPGSPLALPVVEPTATWLAHWSALVAAPGAARLPGAAALLPRRPRGTPRDDRARSDVTRLPAEELVLRFRSTASPEAFRLAGHLAVGEPHLPVMRLVQAAVEPRPRPQHLAEVILSGMLTGAADGTPGRYAFRPGVRELLLRTLPRTARSRTTELLSRAGALIDARAGVTAGEFRAVAPRKAGAGEAHRESDPVAMVSERSVRQLSGPEPEGELVAGRYRLLEPFGESGEVWRAADVREKGMSVVVQRFTARGMRKAADFLAAARALADLRHEHVVSVLDYGVDEETGAAHLVTEYLEGGTLRGLVAAYGGWLPADVLLGLTPLLTAALTAAHAGKVSHGALSPSHVVLSERGPVLSRFALPAHNAATRNADLQALGRLVQEMSLGTHLPHPTRSELQAAVNDLLSGSGPLQQRGVTRLTGLGPPDRAPVRFSFLGPLKITHSGRPLATGSPREQALLWMLLRRPGQWIPDDELAAGLWGGQPPGNAHRLLGTYVSRIRNATGTDLLVRSTAGYAVRPDMAEVDALHCEELHRAANASREEGRSAEGLGLVHSALRLWQGDPLDGVPGPAAAADRDRLNRLLRTLRILRAELHLDLGQADEALDHLTALVRAAPAHQEVRHLHMLALSRLGRTDAALESYEDFLAAGGESDPAIHRLHRGLRADLVTPDTASRAYTSVLVELADPEDEDTHRALGGAIARLVDDNGLGARECGLLPRADGYEILVKTEAAAKRLLTAVVERLADVVGELVPGVPRLLVTFWPVRAGRGTTRDRLRRLLDSSGADSVIGVSQELHALLATTAELGLRADSPRPTYWYALLYPPEAALDEGAEHPVHVLRRRPPGPSGPHRVLVYVGPDGSPTLEEPGTPAVRYYEVDLLERSYFVSATPRTWATVRVVDPVEAVRRVRDHPRDRLAACLAEESGRLPSPLDTEKLERRLMRWRMPGYAVRWSVSADTTPRRATARSALAEPLATAEAFLLGFDGTLVDLYPAAGATREAARDLTALIAELRHPDEALEGAALRADVLPRENGVHPMDVLRTFARHPRLARPLGQRLGDIESAALATARPVPGDEPLVNALKRSGRPVSVVSDVAPQVVSRYLESRRFGTDVEAYGRNYNPYHLMPDPDVLERALNVTRLSPRRGVLIGSTHVELAAARSIGLPFVGYSPSAHTRASLMSAGARFTVKSLAEVVAIALRHL